MNECDRDRVRGLLAGSERAFDEFFEDYFPGLFRFALPRLGYDEDAAEEVAQETLCKVIAKLRTYRGEAALYTWICAFCRNEISAYYRRRGKEAREVDLVEDNPNVRAALESLDFGFDDPDRAFQRTEIARLVQVALDRLPSRYGQALEWKYLESWSVKQIGARLGLSPKAAESLLTRARVAFRETFAALTSASPLRTGRTDPLESP